MAVLETAAQPLYHTAVCYALGAASNPYESRTRSIVLGEPCAKPPHSGVPHHPLQGVCLNKSFINVASSRGVIVLPLAATRL